MKRTKFLVAAGLLAFTALGSGTVAPGMAEVMFRGTGHIVIQTFPLKLAAPADAVIGYGQAWSLEFPASGGKKPYSFAIAGGLPSGISVSGTTLVGRTGAGTYGPFVATLTDSEGKSETATLGSVVVSSAVAPLALTSSSTNFRFPKGSNWQVPFSAYGGLAPYTFAVPGGLSAVSDQNTGVVVSGAGIAGVYTIGAITATDVAGTAATSSPVLVKVGVDASVSVDAVVLDSFTVTPTSKPTKTVVVRNNGDLPTASAPVVTATGSFDVVSPGCPAIVGGGTCSVIVQPKATVNGPFSGSLSISGIASTFAMSGSASGFGPVADMTPDNGTANISSAASPGPATTFTVTNTGYGSSGTVTVSFATATTNFAIQNGGTCTAATSLAHDEACTVLVSRIGTANDTVAKTANLKVVFANAGPTGSPSTDTSVVSGTITNIAAGPCSSTLATGTACTVDGRPAVKLASYYSDLCDIGQTWNGTACTGISTTTTFNDGTTNYSYQGAMGTGPSNTALLAPKGYKAPKVCADLGPKWFLPQFAQLPQLNETNAAYYVVGRKYWTSSEYGSSSPTYAMAISLAGPFAGGYGYPEPKNQFFAIRCWREF